MAGNVICSNLNSTCFSTSSSEISCGTQVNTNGNTLSSGTIYCSNINTLSNPISCSVVDCYQTNIITNSNQYFNITTGIFIDSNAGQIYYELNINSYYSSGVFGSNLTTSFTLLETGDAYHHNNLENWNQYSDRRLKKGVRDIHNSLEKINKLKPVNFKWINEHLHDNKEHASFLADEFQMVFPNLVSKAPIYHEDEDLVSDSTCLSINQDIIPYLVGSNK